MSTRSLEGSESLSFREDISISSSQANAILSDDNSSLEDITKGNYLSCINSFLFYFVRF